MPRPIGKDKELEKSKDFFGSIKRLLSNLKPWKYLLTLAILLAAFSAILALATPDRLSTLADTISKGITPKVEKLNLVSSEIIKNINEEAIFRINISSSITSEERQNFSNVIEALKNKDNQKEIILLLSNVSDTILNEILQDIKIENINISIQEQKEFLKSLRINNGNNTTQLLRSLPKSVYDLIKPSIDMEQVKNISILIGTLYLISAVFSYIESFSMTTISNRFAKLLRTKISAKINKLPLKYFDSHETGDVLSRVTNDVDTIAQNLNNSLATLVTSLTLFVGSIIMMFSTNGIMSITAILSSLIGFSILAFLLGKSQKYFMKRQEELGNMNGYIEEIYSGHNVVKTYNGDIKAIVKFNQLNHKLYEANRKSQFLSGLMMPIMNFVGNFGYVAVCIVGAFLVSSHAISFGVIIAFIIYVRMFTNPLTQIAQAMTALQSTAAAGERVFEFLDEKEMTNESHITYYLEKEKVKGAIEFKNVSFGYNKEKNIIHNFSVKVNPGEKIAIVGPTGAGKTTMVNLLMKFYEINEGDILIDGISVHNLTRENVHELFCMVLQDTWLFEGTIKENIKFNKENVSEEEVWEACQTVGVDHFIKTLPGGLNAIISDNDTVSSGQKQLFTIARGNLEKAPFLILDEATSNVDTRTEELVAHAMDKLSANKTSFIIAHRLSTIKNADLILVMNEGNIVEQGTHEELMKQKGFYEKLYNSQFEM